MFKHDDKAVGDKAVKPLPPNHTHGEETGAVAGGGLGALVGSAAGPAGTLAGMVFGAAAGAMAGKIIDEEAERAHIHDDELDEAIGVTKGSIGVPRKDMHQAKTAAKEAPDRAETDRDAVHG
jgi:outer membrane lipoprotein SlyB